MIRSLLLALAVLAGTLLAYVLMQDRGNVLIDFRGTTVNTTVPVLVLFIALVYIAIRLLIRVLQAPVRLKRAIDSETAARARRNLTRGLIEMAEGNWAKGERLLTKGARSSDTPLLNYLSAARAAQLQGAHQRRDNWLMLAYEKDPAAGTAVMLTQAELQIAHEQYEEALATLRKLDEVAPGQPQCLALLAGIYRRLGDWEQLQALLPKLRSKKALPAPELHKMGCEVHIALLRAAGLAGDRVKMQAVWQAVPKALKNDPGTSKAFVNALRDCGDDEAAEIAIRRALKIGWDDELVLLYGELQHRDFSKALSRAEGWLKSRGDNSALLLTAARLAKGNDLWGKARSYVESSIAINPRAEAYQVYGQLLEQTGENASAASAFRAGLDLLTGSGGSIKALAAPAATESDGNDSDVTETAS